MELPSPSRRRRTLQLLGFLPQFCRQGDTPEEYLRLFSRKYFETGYTLCVRRTFVARRSPGPFVYEALLRITLSKYTLISSLPNISLRITRMRQTSKRAILSAAMNSTQHALVAHLRREHGKKKERLFQR